MAVSALSAVKAVAAARLALAETLLLKVGQVVQAVVVGKTAAGLTTLKIGDQLVQAQLPESLPAGTTLQLAVKAGGATPQLVVVSQTAPGQAPVTLPQNLVVSQTPPGQAQVTLPQTLVVRPLPAPPSVVTAERPAANGEPVQRVAVTSSQIESGVVASAPAAVVQRETQPTVLAARPQGVAPVVINAQVEPKAVPSIVTTTGTIAQAASVGAPSAGPVSAAPAVPAVSSTPPVAGPETPQIMQVDEGVRAPVQPAPLSPVQVTRPSVSPSGAAPVSVAIPATTANALPVSPQALPGLPGERTVIPPPQQPVGSGVQIVPRETAAPRVAVVQVAVEPEAEASNPLLVAQAAARPVATIVGVQRAVAPPVVLAAQTAASPPATPQAALAQMMPEAMAKQNSIGPLLTSLAAVVAKAGALPEPILRAALGVLAQRIVATDGKILAADLERAVAKSGVYLEAGLAKSTPQPGDAKAALLNLRGVLAKQLGETPPSAVARDTAPPPLKGLPLRAPVGSVPDLPDGPRDLVRMLHGQTDAAVSRVKLMQMASLPEADAVRPANQSVRMELPFLIGHELVMAQIQIARDGARRDADRKRGWTMRFALNFSATGEVGAEVGLLGTAVNVSLWAAEPETAVAMNAALPELSEALAALGLTPGAIRIRHGAPEPEKPESGRLLDSVS